MLSFDCVILWGPWEEAPSWWKDVHGKIVRIDTVAIFQCSGVYAKLQRIYDSKWMLSWGDFYLDHLKICCWHYEESICLIFVHRLLLLRVFSRSTSNIVCLSPVMQQSVRILRYSGSTLTIQYDNLCFWLPQSAAEYSRRIMYGISHNPSPALNRAVYDISHNPFPALNRAESGIIQHA